MHSSYKKHWATVKWIFCYLKSTIFQGLFISKFNFDHINTYSDSNWVGYIANKKSMSNYVVHFSANMVSWSSEKQRMTWFI